MDFIIAKSAEKEEESNQTSSNNKLKNIRNNNILKQIFKYLPEKTLLEINKFNKNKRE